MSDHLSQSTCLEMLHPKTDEHLNPSVEVHHLVGKLSTAETLLTAVQCTVPTCPGGFLVINVCNQGNNLCSPCIFLPTSMCILIYSYAYNAHWNKELITIMHVYSLGPLIILECLPSGKATMSSKKHHTNSKLIYMLTFPVRIKHDPL